MRCTAILIAALALGASPLAAQTVPVAPNTGNSNNCFPFGCFYNARYQQVYAARSFAGLTRFNTLSIYRDGQDANAGTATYEIVFYYSNFGPDALSTDLSANRGDFIGSFGTFASANEAIGPVKDFSGALLSYDPMRGALLMDVNVNRTSNGSGGFDAQRVEGDAVSRIFYNGGVQRYDADTTGLVTRFSRMAPAGAVPEPAIWTMLILGFGVVGGALRRIAPQRRLGILAAAK